jgi:hypothetical protein
MKIEITNRWTGAVIHCGEYEDVRACLLSVLKAGADLSGANLYRADLYGANLSRADLYGADLSGADLSGADLYGANLSRADLYGANLSRADLYGANLSGANLSGANLYRANLSRADLYGANLYRANLYGADLSRADLYGANLSGANLSGADLSRADLSGADLSGANLSRADLSRAKNVSAERCTPLLMLYDQPGPQVAYKMVTSEGYGPWNKWRKYEVGETYEVTKANTDVHEQCGAGVNVATLDWCLKNWQDGYRVLLVEFTAADIACIPTATDGMFRLHRCKVVGEKDISDLVKPLEAAAAEPVGRDD